MAMVIENSSCYPPSDSDQTHPWLMVSQGTELQNHTFYSVSKNQSFDRSIPKFRHKQVAPTSYGWLALFDLKTSPMGCCLFNPTSQEEIQLPSIELDLESRRSAFKCILSKPPNDPNCHVLLLNVIDTSLLFCRLGDDKFLKTTDRFKDRYIWQATNFKGKIYSWMFDKGLVEIDFVGQDLIVKQVGRMTLPNVTRWVDYLVDSCGELLLVRMIWHDWWEKVNYFRIFRVNISEGKLEELRSIGDRTIFLCNRVSWSSTTVDQELGGLKKNSIYYTWHDETVVNVYDITYRSKSILRPCPIDSTTSFLMSWIML